MSDLDIAHAAWRVGQAAESFAQEMSFYHATWFSVLKPRLFKDGTAWCALYGENLQEGVSGFGPTPAKALLAFDQAMCNERGAGDVE